LGGEAISVSCNEGIASGKDKGALAMT